MKIDLAETFQRIKTGVKSEFDVTDVADWIEKHTRVGGRAWSYTGREYQQRILKSEAPEIVVKKCSQVGISELGFRRALALCDIIDGFKIIYTLPTTQFAQKVSKTRIDPIIESSPRLKSKLSKQVDNASVKRIGNSYLYISGTKALTEVISTPCDFLAIDELDFSNQENVANLQSRLTASKYRWWFYISTPTLPNFGIDQKFSTTRRHFNHCKCVHCGRWFYPDYLQHVRIPDYDDDLLKITSQHLRHLRWKEATLFCPHCHKPADLSHEHRAWVCENQSDNFDGEGFQVSPTDAPAIIKPSDLVLWSTRFKRKVDFVNYHLGQVMEDSDSGLNDDDINLMEAVGLRHLNGFKVFGLDMGLMCHLVIGVTDGAGRLTVIEKHRLDYRNIEEELNRLIAIHHPTSIVADSQPYVETIHRLQSKINNLYGAVYITTKDLTPFRVIDQTENPQKSLLDKRQININRNVSLNILMDDIRNGLVGVVPDAEQELFRQQLQDMKRSPAGAKTFNGEMSGDDDDPEAYVWVKTKGNDHYHHALLYCHTASQITQHLSNRGTLPFFVGTFKVR